MIRKPYLSAIAASTLLAACGGNSSPGASGGDGGTGALDAGAGGSAAVGGNVGSGGSAASGGAVGGGGQGSSLVSCDTLLQEGSNVFLADNGVTTKEDWYRISVGGSSEELISGYEDRGLLWLTAALPAQPWNLQPGYYPVALAGLVAPTSSIRAGVVTCAEQAMLEVTPAYKSLASAKAKLLGACPGTPVPGSLSYCGGAVDCSTHLLTGDIEGVAPEAVDLVISYGGGEPYIQVTNQDFSIRAFTDDLVEPGKSGSVDWAIIFTRPTSPYGGAVYCAGPGSSWDVTEDESLHLTSLSKLGTCVASSGSAELVACLPPLQKK